MDVVALALVAVVAVLHMFFAYMAMVLWKTPADPQPLVCVFRG